MLKPYVTIITTTFLVGMYQTPQADTFLVKHGIDIGLTTLFPYGQVLQNKIESIKIAGINPITKEKEHTPNNIEIINNTMPVTIENIMPVQVVSTTTATNTLENLSKVQDTKGQNPMSIPDTKAVLPKIKPSDVGETTEEGLAKHLAQAKVEAQNGTNITSTCIHNCTVLMIGDSVMGDVAMSVKRKIKKSNPDWTVIDAHKVSTGLTNSMYYNWPTIAKELAVAKKPDYTYVLIGMNDAQPISMDKHGYVFGKESWTAEYTKRVNAIIDIMKEHSTSGWTWIQLPSVASEAFNTKLDVIRNIQQTNVPVTNYLEVDNLVGSYSNTKDKSTIKTRAGDGIHLNVKGSDSIASVICENIEQKAIN